MNDQDNDFQLERAIGFHVNRTAHLMTEEVARRFAAAGYKVTAQDFGILYRISKQDGLSQSELAALMLRDKTTITRRLDGLVKKGLVERRNDPGDRRLFCIHLTDDGRAAVQQLSSIVDALQAYVLEGATVEEKQITIATLRRIGSNITRSNHE